jgi:tRNA pseudouridine55 synthase
MARRGEKVERQPVRITISEFVALAKNGEAPKPADEEVFDLPVRVVCSAGTYVRTLAEDFGRRLGIGAHLAELRRTRAGEFKICKAVTLDRLAELMQSGSIETVMISADAAVSHLPEVVLTAEEVRRVLHGSDLQLADSRFSVWPDGCAVRMRDAVGDLVAIGIYDEKLHSLHPGVVISSL